MSKIKQVANSKNSKIEELYIHFSKSEKESITRFLQSKLFNQSDILLKIHEYLCQVDMTDELDKPALYKYIYGGREKFNDAKLRVYITKLTQLIEKYIVIKQLDDYPIAELNLLNRYYNIHHLHKNTSVFFNSKKALEFNSYEEYLLYEYQYAAHKLDYIHYEYSSDGAKLIEHYQSMLEAHRNLSAFQLLSTQCQILSLSQKYNIGEKNTYEESVIEEINRRKDGLSIIFQAYLQVYSLFKSFDESSFLELKNLIVSNNEIQYKNNIKTLNLFLQNFCIRNINSGETSYLTHLFDCYNFGLQFVKVSGDLSSASFRNIVFCALQLKELAWAENFVEYYSDKVIEADKTNAYNFNLARISFEKGEYKIAMRHLLRVTYEDAFYASTARILLIKCYYELNDEMPFQSYCASLLQFLKRSKDFTKQRVENNMHFISFVRKLQNQRLKANKQTLNKMKTSIESSSTIEKDWLLKKLSEI